MEIVYQLYILQEYGPWQMNLEILYLMHKITVNDTTAPTTTVFTPSINVNCDANSC
jgi:hypothetical protein